MGWGQSENSRSKGDAFEKAQKQAVSDARKRGITFTICIFLALRIFGSYLGNCLYDKQHLHAVKRQKMGQGKNTPKLRDISSTTFNPAVYRSTPNPCRGIRQYEACNPKPPAASVQNNLINSKYPVSQEVKSEFRNSNFPRKSEECGKDLIAKVLQNY